MYHPHGYCYLWEPGLVWMHAASDVLIGAAYYCIPIILVYLVRKRRDLPFNWMFLLFAAFILACGTSHLMEVWNLWHANYVLSGGVKVVTAAASVGTAIMLARLVPVALRVARIAV